MEIRTSTKQSLREALYHFCMVDFSDPQIEMVIKQQADGIENLIMSIDPYVGMQTKALTKVEWTSYNKMLKTSYANLQGDEMAKTSTWKRANQRAIQYLHDALKQIYEMTVAQTGLIQ